MVVTLKTTNTSNWTLAVSLANVTEGPARATVLKVTRAEPSHGFVASQALVDGHGNNATTHTCDAQEVQRCRGIERKGAGKKGPSGSGPWHRGKGADEWTSGKRGGKEGSKGSIPISKGQSETRYCYDCGEQGHIGVNCTYKWANSIVGELARRRER